MPYEICRQIKTNGRRCQSPAIKGENWCFFHHRFHFRRRALRPTGVTRSNINLLIPPVEDREAIQVALSLVIEATASGQLDEKLARLLLCGLQIASRNAAGLELQVAPSACVSDYLPTLDGIELANRAMSDGSEPPAFVPPPYIPATRRSTRVKKAADVPAPELL